MDRLQRWFRTHVSRALALSGFPEALDLADHHVVRRPDHQSRAAADGGAAAARHAAADGHPRRAGDAAVRARVAARGRAARPRAQAAVVIASDIARGIALLAIPIAAFTDNLSIEILYVVGFFCGVQNVVGGAAYQVLLAQLAGRKRLVEANAKIALGETSSALVGPGVAGGLIQLLTAPFAILLDAVAFFASGADAAARPRAERRAARRARRRRSAPRSSRG